MSERLHRRKGDTHDSQRNEDPEKRSKRAPRARAYEADHLDDRTDDVTRRRHKSERPSSSGLPSQGPAQLTEGMMSLPFGSDAPKNSAAPSEAMEHSLNDGPVVVKFDKNGKLVSIKTGSQPQIPRRQADGRQEGDTQETRAARPRDRVFASTHSWLEDVPHSPTRTDISFRDNSPLGSRTGDSLQDSRTDEKRRSSPRRRREYPDDRIKESKQTRSSHGKRDDYSGEPEQRSSRRPYNDREPHYDESRNPDDRDRRQRPTKSRRETSREGGRRSPITEQSGRHAIERSYHESAPRSTRSKRYDEELSGSDITVRPSPKPSHAPSKKSRRPSETAAEPSRRQAQRQWMETNAQATSISSSYNTRPADHDYCTGSCCVPPPSQYYSPRRAETTVGPSHGTDGSHPDYASPGLPSPASYLQGYDPRVYPADSSGYPPGINYRG